MAEKIIEEHITKDPITKKILDKYEIHIMPLVNPDGYEYTWTDVSAWLDIPNFNDCKQIKQFHLFCLLKSRLWRKNRAPNAGSSCIGVDLNRNFGFQWMVSIL